MTPQKVKQMQTALLKYNELARFATSENSNVPMSLQLKLEACLERGEEALKVEVAGRS